MILIKNWLKEKSSEESLGSENKKFYLRDGVGVESDGRLFGRLLFVRF